MFDDWWHHLSDSTTSRRRRVSILHEQSTFRWSSGKLRRHTSSVQRKKCHERVQGSTDSLFLFGVINLIEMTLLKILTLFSLLAINGWDWTNTCCCTNSLLLLLNGSTLSNVELIPGRCPASSMKNPHSRPSFWQHPHFSPYRQCHQVPVHLYSERIIRAGKIHSERIIGAENIVIE